MPQTHPRDSAFLVLLTNCGASRTRVFENGRDLEIRKQKRIFPPSLNPRWPQILGRYFATPLRSRLLAPRFFPRLTVHLRLMAGGKEGVGNVAPPKAPLHSSGAFSSYLALSKQQFDLLRRGGDKESELVLVTGNEAGVSTHGRFGIGLRTYVNITDPSVCSSPGYGLVRLRPRVRIFSAPGAR